MKIRKDETLNSFIAELRDYHKRGFTLTTPCWQENTDENNNVNYVYVEIGMEKVNPTPRKE